MKSVAKDLKNIYNDKLNVGFHETFHVIWELSLERFSGHSQVQARYE